MNRQPDKLFRDKLYGYEKPVSEEIWARIAGRTSSANRWRGWLTAAASVVIIAAAGVLIFPSLRSDQPMAVTKQKTKAQTTTPETSKADKTQSEQAQRAESTASPGMPQVIDQERVPSRPSVKRTQTQPLESKSSGEAAPIADMYAHQEVVSNRVAAENATTATTSSEPIAPRKTVTIVFSQVEVNEKYLSRKYDAQATSEVKESSTLRNLIDKAQDLKHNQDPLGELRQKKDEILAMSFRKDKQRTEKN